MAAGQRGAQPPLFGDDDAATVAGEDPQRGAATGNLDTDASAWAPPPAQPYLAPELAPEPMGAADAPADPDLPWWLALNRIKGIGPARFTLLLDAFGSARAAWEAAPAEWRRAGLDERTA